LRWLLTVHADKVDKFSGAGESVGEITMNRHYLNGPFMIFILRQQLLPETFLHSKRCA